MLAALLVPCVDRSIYDVTQAMASLGDMEIKWKDKGVHSVQFSGTKAKKGSKKKPDANKKHAMTDPVKVSIL
jgi:hypothetical protein